MKTAHDCIPCFFKQAIRAAEIAGATKKEQKEIADRISLALPKFSMDSCPSEMGAILYGIVRKVTGNNDPYLKIKRKSNKMALKVFEQMKSKLKHSKDKLLTAVELAIAGNIIDCGTRNMLDINKELDRILADEHKTITKESKTLFNYSKFKAALKKSENILYIGDNAGEIVFDRVLLEEISHYGKPKKYIIFSVREEPIINDALMEDALFCGIDRSATVISSGVDAPGTILSKCTKNFLRVFNKADLIISKGQGNFEALSNDKKARKRPIFFLFMTKCAVSARDVGCEEGKIILKSIKG